MTDLEQMIEALQRGETLPLAWMLPLLRELQQARETLASAKDLVSRIRLMTRFPENEWFRCFWVDYNVLNIRFGLPIEDVYINEESWLPSEREHHRYVNASYREAALAAKDAH